MLVLDNTNASSATPPFDDLLTNENAAVGENAVNPNAERTAYDAVVQEMYSLISPQEDGEAPPTPYALERTEKILAKVFRVMEKKHSLSPSKKWTIPAGCVSTDESGGLRIEWWHQRTHCVTLAVGHDEKSPTYVFIKKGQGDPGILYRHVFPAWLASRLGELNEVRAIQG